MHTHAFLKQARMPPFSLPTVLSPALGEVEPSETTRNHSAKHRRQVLGPVESPCWPEVTCGQGRDTSRTKTPGNAGVRSPPFLRPASPSFPLHPDAHPPRWSSKPQGVLCANRLLAPRCRSTPWAITPAGLGNAGPQGFASGLKSPGAPITQALAVEASVCGSLKTCRLCGTRTPCTSQSRNSPSAQEHVWESLGLGDHPAAAETSR